MDTVESQETPQGAGDTPDSKIIEIAKAVGYKEDGPLSAEDFLKTMPDRFHSQGKELKRIEKTMQGMAQQFKAVTEAQYRKGIQDAEKRMAEAKQELDIDAYDAARYERDQLKHAAQSEQREPELLPEVEAFIERNTWFDQDKAMTADALIYKKNYLETNPHANIDDVLSYVERRIKRDYPEEFQPKGKDNDDEETPKGNKRPVSAVEGAANRERGKDPISKLKSSMDAEERRIMDQFVKFGGMTEEEYLKSYAQVKGA